MNEEKLTLVELAEKWSRGEVNDEKAKKIYVTIPVYTPEKTQDGTKWTIGDNNAWFDVENFAEISLTDYYAFYDLIFAKSKKIKKEGRILGLNAGMPLVEIAQKWKNREITNEQARKEFKDTDITSLRNLGGEYSFADMPGHSWLEVRTNTNLTREERIAFRKVVEVEVNPFEQMTLVELAKKWKDREITSTQAINIYNDIKVFRAHSEDGKMVLSCGNKNSWKEVEEESGLSMEEVLALRKVLNVDEKGNKIW